MRFGDSLILRTRDRKRALILRADAYTGRFTIYLMDWLAPELEDSLLLQYKDQTKRVYLDFEHFNEALHYLQEQYEMAVRIRRELGPTPAQLTTGEPQETK